MKVAIYKEENEKYIQINFSEHKKVFVMSKIDIAHQDNLQVKLKIIDEFLASFSPKYDRRGVLFAWAKVDEQVADYYKTLYPRGGKHENAGRKFGYRSDKPKSEKTSRFTMAITEEEKIYLIKKLKEFRLKNMQ